MAVWRHDPHRRGDLVVGRHGESQRHGGSRCRWWRHRYLQQSSWQRAVWWRHGDAPATRWQFDGNILTLLKVLRHPHFDVLVLSFSVTARSVWQFSQHHANRLARNRTARRLENDELTTWGARCDALTWCNRVGKPHDDSLRRGRRRRGRCHAFLCESLPQSAPTALTKEWTRGSPPTQRPRAAPRRTRLRTDSRRMAGSRQYGGDRARSGILTFIRPPSKRMRHWRNRLLWTGQREDTKRPERAAKPRENHKEHTALPRGDARRRPHQNTLLSPPRAAE